MHLVTVELFRKNSRWWRLEVRWWFYVSPLPQSDANAVHLLADLLGDVPAESSPGLRLPLARPHKIAEIPLADRFMHVQQQHEQFPVSQIERVVEGVPAVPVARVDQRRRHLQKQPHEVFAPVNQRLV